MSRRRRVVIPEVAPGKEEGASSAEKTSKGKLRVQNIVVSVTFADHVDLDKVVETFRDVEHKDNFPGLVLRLSKPKSTILLFKSGKMVLTGMKKREDVLVAVGKVLKRFKSLDIEVMAEPEIRVQNIVVSGDLGKHVDLDTASTILEDVIFEPEVFPGLICRKEDPKTCILVFSSGKIVCTGMKEEASILKAVQAFAGELKDNGLLLDRYPIDGAGLESLDFDDE